jgi:exonuclease III
VGEGVVMKLVSWNVRGLGGPEKKREVRSLIKEKCPFIVCLQETKLQNCDISVCSAMWDVQKTA